MLNCEFNWMQWVSRKRNEDLWCKAITVSGDAALTQLNGRLDLLEGALIIEAYRGLTLILIAFLSEM